MQTSEKLSIWLTAIFSLTCFLFTTCFTFGNAAHAKQDEATEVQNKAADEKADASDSYDQAANMASFEKVWSTIKQTHWDEDIVGPNWDDAKAKYKPKAEAATSISEMRKIIEAMIAELGQSHFGVISNDSYEAMDLDGGSGNATTGMTFRMINDEAVVTKVREGSSAEKAGIVPGWTLVSYKGKEISKAAEKIKKAAHGPMRFETLAGMAMERILGGNDGEEIKLVMTDGNGETQEVSVELSTPEGKEATFGNLPAMWITHEAKTLDGKVGYFTFNAFFDPATIMTAYRETVHSEDHANGIVIDLRGNIGGIAGMTMGMATELASEPTELGVMTMKGTELRFAVSESSDPVTCPVAVLIDEVSISSAEIFSGGLQDIGVARVFGSRSAGLALPSTIIKLPNGDGFQFAIANYVSASGKVLEMDGVSPDEEITLSKELLLRDKDPVLNRALEWIKEQNKK